MTPKQLRYFIEIARQLSFTKASATLHITQPALSRQMQDLEQTLGVKLFTRSDLGVSLTAAGRHLTDRAPVLLESFRQVSLDVAALSDVPAGSLRFGIPPSLCDLVTIPSVQHYVRRYPNVRLSITEASSAELTELISSGALDFAIVATSDSTTRFRCVPLIQERMYLASRRNAVSGPSTVDPLFVAKLPLVASRRPNSLRRILDEAMDEANLKPNIYLEANSVRILTQVTADGTANCVLPYSAIAKLVSEGKLEAREVKNLFVNWGLLHVRNVERTPSVNALIKTIVDIARQACSGGRWDGVRVVAPESP